MTFILAILFIMFVLGPIARAIAASIEKSGEKRALEAPTGTSEQLVALSDGAERWRGYKHMIGLEDLESYLIRTELDYEEIGEGIWAVHPSAGEEEQLPAILVNHAPPVIVLRSDVQRAPEDEEEQRKLYGRLLELNATEVVHGAYGLENGQILLSDTLELADLDFSEFQASVESIALALSSYKQNLETD